MTAPKLTEAQLDTLRSIHALGTLRVGAISKADRTLFERAGLVYGGTRYSLTGRALELIGKVSS